MGNSNRPGIAGSLASDVGDRAIKPATAQPITSFLIQPPNNDFPSPSKRWIKKSIDT
jgi:hypothetical protein